MVMKVERRDGIRARCEARGGVIDATYGAASDSALETGECTGAKLMRVVTLPGLI